MGKQTLPPRLHQADNGWWYVLYHEHGRGQRKALRTQDQKIAAERFSGWIDQYQLDTKISLDPTISEILDLWFNQWVDGRMLSQERYPSVINNLNQHFGDMPVSSVLREHSVKYQKLRRSGIIGRCPASESTIRHELTRLRAALNFMVDRVEPKERRLDRSILPYIERPAASPPRDRVLSYEELDLIYQYSLEDRNRQVLGSKARISREGRFCILAMETAQRKSAIQELKWEQVDFATLLIKFNPDGRIQTQKRRPTLPISEKLLVMLQIAYEERINDYVLDVKTDVHYGVKRIFEDLGIETASPHTFRHTFATHRITEGVPVDKVAMFLGDEENTVRKNYAHLQPDYLREVVEQKSKSQNAFFRS